MNTDINVYKPLTGKLELCPIKVKEEYRKKWNMYAPDFVFLTKDGEILNNTLYRVGGINTPDLNANYFMLLKYVEAYYDDSITNDPKRKRHLKSQWVIIDKHGKERVEFKPFDTAGLVKDSLLYTIDNKFYNIETGECYGKAYTSMQSSEYLFIDRAYDEDESKRGVLRINKKDGSTQLYN